MPIYRLLVRPPTPAQSATAPPAPPAPPALPALHEVHARGYPLATAPHEPRPVCRAKPAQLFLPAAAARPNVATPAATPGPRRGGGAARASASPLARPATARATAPGHAAPGVSDLRTPARQPAAGDARRSPRPTWPRPASPSPSARPASASPPGRSPMARASLVPAGPAACSSPTSTDTSDSTEVLAPWEVGLAVAAAQEAHADP